MTPGMINSQNFCAGPHSVTQPQELGLSLFAWTLITEGHKLQFDNTHAHTQTYTRGLFTCNGDLVFLTFDKACES